jgi:PAS domain S-box-containing protein
MQGSIGPAGRQSLQEPVDDATLLELLVDRVVDYAIVVLTPEGRVASWNAGAERMKGYTADEIIGHHVERFYTVDERAAGLPARLLARARDEGRIEDEGWRVRKDGTRFWADVVITALNDDEGILRGFAKVTRDLTARRAAEVRLRRAERRTETLVDSIKEYAIFMLSPDGTVLTWNQGAEHLKGYAPHEIIGQSFTRFYTAASRAAGIPESLLAIARDQGRVEDEGWRVRKDGSQFWGDVVITALRDEAGRTIGFAKVTRDLTERRQAEEDRAARLAAERAAERARDSFLDALAHDLKTPVVSLIMHSRLLKRQTAGGWPEDRCDFDRALGAILANASAIAASIDELHDLTRLEARIALPLNRVRFDLVELVRTAAGSLSDTNDQRSIQVDAEQARLPISGDRARLNRVFGNLLENAMKYSPTGSPITIHVGLEVRPEAMWAEVQVTDRGIGIPGDELEHVFDRRYRGASSSATSGEGIGLASVRQIVELHGGTVAMASELGVGTVVTVRLPARPAAAW